jgi:microcystin-dependent protein
MAITVSLGFNPMWYIADLTGKPNGNGTIEFFSSVNPDFQKPVYQDAAMTIPWTNPILIPLNGQLNQPIYFTNDSTIPGDNYYIEVRDDMGNIVWTMDGYYPSGGGGSGGTPVYNNFKNFIKNNGFWHGQNSSGASIPPTFTIAPSNHAGFALSPIGNGQNYQSDIYYSRNDNAGATLDSITILPFAVGAVPFNPDDVTPISYLNYTCTSAAGETAKNIIFPIQRSVNTFEQKTVTFTLWTQSITGNNSLNVNFLQFFGTGGTGTIPTNVGAITMSAGWSKSVITFTVPSTSGGTIGPAGDDFVAIVLALPSNTASNFNIAKPSFYLGAVNPFTDYDTFDEADSVSNTPRTGDIRSAAGTFAPYGWVPLTDLNGTASIGTAGSAATTRANIDTFPLYQLLYVNIPTLLVSGGRTGTTPAAAFTDFTASKTLALPAMSGRSLAASGQGAGLTNRVLGAAFGEENHILTEAELATHSHPGSFAPTTNHAPTPFPPNQFISGTNLATTPPGAAAISIASDGSNVPHNTMQPTNFFNFFMKL